MKDKISFAENRNIYMPTKEMKKELLKSYKYIFEYPDYKNTEVNECISKYFNVKQENITITNGSLEGINLLVDVLKENETVLFEPTFWGYEDALTRYKYTINKEALNDNLGYDFEKINLVASKSKLLIICNPNNPTLSYVPKDVLMEIIKNNPFCHFIVDETMLIFDEEYSSKTITKEVEKLNNLSVVVSFSKFLGIAGLRMGALFSNDKLINKVKKQNIPYSLGIIQQHILPIALKYEKKLNNTRYLISNNRSHLCNDLEKIGCKVLNGSTNFVLVNLPSGIDATKLSSYLNDLGMEIRNIKEAYPQLNGDWIRISINTKKNNKKLVKAIENYVNRK